MFVFGMCWNFFFVRFTYLYDTGRRPYQPTSVLACAESEFPGICFVKKSLGL